jgi:benzylsuccinate CoA-transferase BbsF subunit/naphthyl-2-methylsuccinate CoA transferase subunit
MSLKFNLLEKKVLFKMDKQSKATKKLPLEGIRILDFTVVWAGPFATQLLAEWGAEVIRVESTKFFPSTTRGILARPSKELVQQGGIGGYPDADPGERPWNRAALFNVHARNKLSMTVDLTTPEGQEIFANLVSKSDGLIENNAIATMERAGVSWEKLSKINPEFVLVRMPAFGISGPYKNYRTFGSHMESLVGHYSLFGYEGETPEASGTSLFADPASGVSGALAFMSGLRHRRNTGKGIQIESPTAENFANQLGPHIVGYSMTGVVPEYTGNRHPVYAPQGVYRCKGEDRWISITITDDAEWDELCSIMGAKELSQNSEYGTVEKRRMKHDVIDQAISNWTIKQDNIELMNMLQDRGIPAGAVMNEKDAFEDPHLQERGYWEELTHPEAGTYKYPGVLWKSKAIDNKLRRAAPRLGEDNEYVYKSILGYTEAEYQKYEKDGHIGMDYDDSIQ